MEYYRHGDVTLEVINEAPKDLKKVKSNKVVVALGEVTGHSHSVIPLNGSEVSILTPDGNPPNPNDDNIYFYVDKGGALIVHEEHEPILLKEGIYQRKMKVQFNPFTNAIENVRD